MAFHGGGVKIELFEIYAGLETRRAARFLGNIVLGKDAPDHEDTGAYPRPGERKFAEGRGEVDI